MRTTILAGATLAAIALSACNGTPAQHAPAIPTTAAESSSTAASRPAASTNDYAKPVAATAPDLAASIAKLHADCDATSGADPECPLDAFTVSTSAQLLADGLGSLPTDVGPPPSEIAALVSDTVTAAGQVETDGFAFYHQQATWAKLTSSLTTLEAELSKWAPYGV